MAEDEQTQDDASEVVDLDFAFPSDWPSDAIQRCETLFTFDLEEVEGKNRLGALAFAEAPALVDDIRSVVRDLAQEPWEDLPPTITGALTGQAEGVSNILTAMLELTSQQPDAHSQAEALNQQLRDHRGWFYNDARPYALRAKIDRRLEERGTETPGDAEVAQLRNEFASLSDNAQDVRRELEARRDLANQFREAARISASEELAGVFGGVARDRGATARNWLVALVIAGAVAAGGAVFIFLVLRPDAGTSDTHDFAALGLGVFLLGLLAFGVRVCAQNYRVNRHQEATANAKAAALSTFQRLAGSVEEEELRSAVTLTVAQAVFVAEDTGFVDSSADHVTLVERALATPRLPSSGSQ